MGGGPPIAARIDMPMIDVDASLREIEYAFEKSESESRVVAPTCCVLNAAASCVSPRMTGPASRSRSAISCTMHPERLKNAATSAKVRLIGRKNS